MNKTLFGLALLSYNYDTHKKDIIDSYIPLVCNVILKKGYNKINREIIKQDFLENYGIQTPLGAIESILKRMTKYSYLVKDKLEYLIQIDTISQLNNPNQNFELDTAFKRLVIDLSLYSKNNFDLEISAEDVEIGLISFFREYDLIMLFSYLNNDTPIKGIGVLPTTKESKRTKYIIAKFITDLQSEDPARYSIIIKLAKGYIIASLITCLDINHYAGSLSQVDVYLDAPIIFNLLGVNGDSNLNLTKELIEGLKENGANLKLFETNYGEVIKTIQDAIKRLTTGDFDITKSSRILRTAIRENISSQQLTLKLNQLDNILAQQNIIKTPSVTLLRKDYQYQINEEKLIQTIEKIYSNSNGLKLPKYKVTQIERDVESISSIFKIRKNNHATSLKTCKAILVTSNQYVAYAAMSFEFHENPFKSNIPACVTDIFLSTILWANYPKPNDKLHIRQLMSECYSIIELDNRLLNKYYEDIQKMHVENTISDEQFYLLSATNLGYSLLEHKTYNDFEEYTDRTANEILQDIEISMNEKVVFEQKKHLMVEQNIRKISKNISKVTFLIIVLILIIISLSLKAFSPKLDNNIFNISIWCISGFLGVFGFLRWFELIPPKGKIESNIEEFVYNKIHSKFYR